MTTRLSKTVKREVHVPRHGDLIVSLAPEGVYYREKGRRTAFLLPHGVAYQRAADIHVARIRAEKRAARAARRR